MNIRELQAEAHAIAGDEHVPGAKFSPHRKYRYLLTRQLGLHAVAYVSHVVFIWASLDERVLIRATQRLLEHLVIPPTRLVYDH